MRRRVATLRNPESGDTALRQSESGDESPHSISPMSQIDDLFRRLKADKRKAFMPFVTAGDPDLEFTADALKELDKAGCTLCEIGIPYSDPIADGPVIQASYTRALAKQIKLAEILSMLKTVTPNSPAPVVT